ncbi:MAG: hypothetical protein HYT80_03600 [Euryarchaeota archaeon]|nr:hypothetical protein [Euryarchaeota archaeon]
MSFWVLYAEGLRAITRSKMSAVSLAILLGGVALFAVFVGTYADGNDIFLFLAYLVVPSGVAALAAIQLATPRTTKFVQAVFTAPVSRPAYLAAHVAVAVTVGALYIAFTLPFMGLHALHDAMPPDFASYVAAGLLLTLHGAAFGTLAGTVCTGRSIIPAALVGALPILLLLCVPLVFAAVWSWEYDPVTGVGALSRDSRILLHLAHASPHVNVMDGLGLWSEEVVPKQPVRSTLWLLGSAVGMIVSAAWIFLRLQGVEDWESSGRKQAGAAFLVLALLAAPAIQPDADNYRNPEDLFESGGYYYDDGSRRAEPFVVSRGTPADIITFYNSRWERPLKIGAPNLVDVVIPLVAPDGTNVTAVNVTFEGVGELRLVGLTTFESDPWTPNETVAYLPYLESRKVPLLRLPATLFIDGSEALANARFLVNVTGFFTAAGFEEPREENGTREWVTENFVIENQAEFIASVPRARTQAAAVMVPIPLAFLVGGIVRWNRRR